MREPERAQTEKKKAGYDMRDSFRSFLCSFFLGLLSFGIPGLIVCTWAVRRFFGG